MNPRQVSLAMLKRLKPVLNHEDVEICASEGTIGNALQLGSTVHRLFHLRNLSTTRKKTWRLLKFVCSQKPASD